MDEHKAILYIGKATSLRDRVRSYFSQDIASARGPKIVAMLEKMVDVKWQTTDSVLEALLLEAQLIKKHQPPYNTDEKDDKSFYSVIITKEQFPRVLLVRGRDMQVLQSVIPAKAGIQKPLTSDFIKTEANGILDSRLRGNDKYRVSDYKKKNVLKIKYTFGPFPQGGSLKEALKIVRKIFPFRDVCKPLSGKPCFNAQIGLCPGVCAGMIKPQEYAKTIRNIKLFFEGKKSTIVKKLEKEMGEYAKNLAFEKAQAAKKTLFALSHIYDVSLLRKDILDSDRAHLFRIEAYDVAHLSGKDVVGVMTVLENGLPNKNEYRQFKLSIERNDDAKNLEEILTRRLKHREWRFPDLIVVDGFDIQISVAHKVLNLFNLLIPVVGVVKDEHHKPKGILGAQEFAEKYHDATLLANSEAHRFAITFHRKRRAKSFLK